MIMADVLKIFLIIVGLLIVYVSYWLLAQALFPRMVGRASQLYSQPVKISLIGLLATPLPLGLGILISKLPNPLLKVIGVTLMVIPALLGLIGSAGLTLRIGAGLPSPADAAQPWRRVLRGGVLLAFSFLLPVVGWFVLPIWALVSGFGAFIICVREQRQNAGTAGPANLVPVAGGME
ncbi:MAG: hypothetical protein JWQ04_2903 [Pedosphaera sp.]|nr:hypothetical protein [Pedosphaera sp.]